VANVAVQVVYCTDNIVVGALVSAGAVTFYAIGGSLINYARQVVGSMTATFVPLASSFDAQGSKDRQQQLLIYGTRATLLIGLPVCIVLMLQGPRFIGLWMGPQFVTASGTVLRILLLGQICALGNLTSAGILQGVAKHRVIGVWGISEGIANLGLSVVLVRFLGINGVAWGTTIPNIVLHLFFWPFYVSKIVGLSAGKYIWDGWILPFFSMIPFTVGYYLVESFWPSSNIRTFFAHVGLASPAWIIPVAIIFRKELTKIIKPVRSHAATATP
jgi:O-antigen/teichoic acid export membrane protein